MKEPIVSKLIDAVDFPIFRELSRKVLELRGFRRMANSDGWSDGGRDIRIYNRVDNSDVRIAIQTSVEKHHWKKKIREDAEKCSSRLKCHSMLYVTSRRIADGEFYPIQDECLSKYKVSVSKMDQDGIATLLIENGETDWFLDLLGVSSSNRKPRPTSIREEARNAFVLFSDETRDFRDEMIDQVILICLFHSGASTSRESLIEIALDNLDGSRSRNQSRVSSSIDRLLQRGSIEVASRKYRLSSDIKTRIGALKGLVDTQWSSLEQGIKEVLKKYLGPKADPSVAAGKTCESFANIYLSYRNYQAIILTNGYDEAIKLKYLKDVSKASTVLLECGVREDQITNCLESLIGIADRYPVLSRLTTGEVFSKLMNAGKSTLLQAIGGSGEIEALFDTPVLIPIACTKLHNEVPDADARSAIDLHNACMESNTTMCAPYVYLEECATHLIDAASYRSIVEEGLQDDLRLSENAYVSYFVATKQGRGEFPAFLESFGYRRASMDRTSHKHSAIREMKGILQKYDIHTLDMRGVSASRDVETDLAWIYRERHEDRPSILQRHDALVATMIRETTTVGKIRILVTWDRTLLELCKKTPGQWWCMDPGNAADTLRIGGEEKGGDSGLKRDLLYYEDDTLKKAAQIWDTIVKIEKDKLTDAKLLAAARKFKEQYLNRQKSDDWRTKQIIEAWKRWKATQ